MEVSGRRRAGVKSSVVAGSVWESRMKLDEVKGGIKVFTGDEKEDPLQISKGKTESLMVRKCQGTGGSGVAVSGKRKTWKSESFDGPIQIAKGKTQSLPKKGPTLSASADGLVVKSQPVQAKRDRSDGNGKNPVLGRRVRSGIKEVGEVGGLFGEVKSGGVQVSGQESSGLEEAENVVDEGIEDSPSEENCVEFGICEDKGKVVKSPPQLDSRVGDHDDYDEADDNNDDDDKDNVVLDDDDDKDNVVLGDDKDNVVLDDDDDDGDVEHDEGEEEDEEIEVKQSLEIKEIGIPEELKKTDKLETIEVSVPTPTEELKNPKPSLEISKPELKPKKVATLVNEVKRVHQFGNRTAPSSPTITRQPPPVIKRATVQKNIPIPTPTAGRGFQRFPETPTHHSHSKLQNLVNLVMWRDVSRSAFVFGIGTFIIISSSYTKDLNVSFISVISYLGLVYLASIFLYRSLITREVDSDYGSYVVGEDEAIWILKLVLPYLNECLLKIKALFSGDPATTMKLAVLLFVFARCGNSLTIWKMVKLGFFGVFTVPKVCSSYSSQLTAYGKFWIRRFRDAWESCSHKKAVALAIFTLVWNFTSTLARVWAVFMMFVAVRYYQQTMELSDDWGEEQVIGDQTWEDNNVVGGAQRQGSTGPNNKIPSSLGAQTINAKIVS